MNNVIAVNTQAKIDPQGSLDSQGEMTLRKLLVIDDEEDICELVADIAELVGYEADSISQLNSQEELTGLEAFDVLALDLPTPDTWRSAGNS